MHFVVLRPNLRRRPLECAGELGHARALVDAQHSDPQYLCFATVHTGSRLQSAANRGKG